MIYNNGKEIKIFKALSKRYIEPLKNMLDENGCFGQVNSESVLDLMTNHTVYIAEIEGRVVGSITLYYHNDFTEIKHLAVDKDFRSRGIAKQLLDFALEYYKTLKPLRAVGWVKPTGWDAEKLMKNKGFTFYDHDLSYWKKDCHSTEYCPYHKSGCPCSAKLAEKVIR